MSPALPLPPEHLRVAVGPFAEPCLFERGANEMAAEIIAMCGLAREAKVLEVGCGCGRLSRALSQHLKPRGRYEGFDLSREAIGWCRDNLQPHLPNFGFTHVDVRSATLNPNGMLSAEAVHFPYPDAIFDTAIVASVFTHMMPAAIDNYVHELARVLRPGGACYMTVLLFDDEAAAAVENGSTIFDFRHAIGPCLTFDREHPDEGIACPADWLVDLLARYGFGIETVCGGNWRRVRSYEVTHDRVLARTLRK